MKREYHESEPEGRITPAGHRHLKGVPKHPVILGTIIILFCLAILVGVLWCAYHDIPPVNFLDRP